MYKINRLVGFVLFLMVLVCGVVIGDGKVFSQRSVKVAPDIPSQKAVLAYRDGVETLIIETAFDGDGKEFGWVIPLPSVPTEFEAASAGFIEVLSSETQPYIRNSVYFRIPTIAIVAVGLWFLLLVGCKVKYRSINLLLLFVIGVMGFGLFFLTIIFNSEKAGGYGGGGGVSAVKVLKTEEVGSYGLAVLDAENSDGLDEWLIANGFVGLNEQERGVVSDYIEDGWCFVAAKLKREGEGYSVPHPLSMKFESDRAVYPMRLTGTVGSNVYLELFVIADKGAVVDGMTLEFADRFKTNEHGVYSMPMSDDKGREIKRDGFTASRFGWEHRIGHPESFKVMWESCFVSRLCGEIEPMQMDKDIVVQFTDMEPSLKTYNSALYVACYAYKLGGYCWILIVVIGTFLFHKRSIGDRGRRFALRMILLPGVMVGCAVGGVTYLAMDKVHATTSHNNPYGIGMTYNGFEGLISVAAGEDGFEGMAMEDVKSAFERALITCSDEYYVKGIEFGDGPWDIEVMEDERGVYLRVYLGGGFPMDYILNEWLEGVEERKKERERFERSIIRIS